MKILLINIDSTKPNLALKKIEKYHRDKGDEVVWDFPLMARHADKIYVSAIYTWSRGKCAEWEGRAEIGGSGYDLKKTLPPGIEGIKPRINWGFTTRGCVRHCPFCVVWKKEGGIRATGDIYDIWDGVSEKIVLLDNNILALPDHFFKICGQLKKENLKVDFNQGLDCRLLTEKMARALKRLRVKHYRFAFDHPSQKPAVEKAVDLLKKYKMQAIWYVLVGFNTSIKEDLERLDYLRANGQAAFVQRYNYIKKPVYIRMAQWANQHGVFRKMAFEQFLSHPKNRAYAHLLKKEGGKCRIGNGIHSSRGW